jgi:DNA primase small subunit
MRCGTDDYSPSSPQVMSAFYRRLFPYKPFFQWLSQDHSECCPTPMSHRRDRLNRFKLPPQPRLTTGLAYAFCVLRSEFLLRCLDTDKAVSTKLFTHREFAFTLAGDVYVRYNSFQTIDEFKKEVLRLTPSRFEIGPQYSARVSAVPVMHQEVFRQPAGIVDLPSRLEFKRSARTSLAHPSGARRR